MRYIMQWRQNYKMNIDDSTEWFTMIMLAISVNVFRVVRLAQTKNVQPSANGCICDSRIVTKSLHVTTTS